VHIHAVLLFAWIALLVFQPLAIFWIVLGRPV
jgi:hypothetical protein